MKQAKGKGATKKETKEALKPAEDRKAGKRKAAIKAEKSRKPSKKAKAAAKDPSKPKRPPSAFFLFLEEFRKVFKQENPNVKAVSAVGKAGGEKWKSMSDAEKAPYEAKAAKKKIDHEKVLLAYNKKQEDDGSHEESDKSKSEVNNHWDEGSDEEGEGEDEEEDDD